MYHGNVNINLENLENGRKCNSNQKWNNDKCQCVMKNAKNIMHAKKIISGILAYAFVEMANN